MQGEQEGEHTSKSSPFHRQATHQTCKRTPEFVPKPSTCRDARSHTGVSGWEGRGVSGCPPWAPGLAGTGEGSQPPPMGPGRRRQQLLQRCPRSRRAGLCPQPPGSPPGIPSLLSDWIPSCEFASQLYQFDPWVSPRCSHPKLGDPGAA